MKILKIAWDILDGLGRASVVLLVTILFLQALPDLLDSLNPGIDGWKVTFFICVMFWGIIWLMIKMIFSRDKGK